MKETKDDSLFAELTLKNQLASTAVTIPIENCYRPTRHVVYRRNCDGSFRVVYRYY
jgi:hypothetical protein